MKFYLISDNHDTVTGLRLAGIEGEVVHERSEVEAALSKAIKNEEIGVVLMTEQLVEKCPDTVYDLKMHRTRPLIVEIPDRHAEGRSKDSIMRYILHVHFSKIMYSAKGEIKHLTFEDQVYGPEFEPLAVALKDLKLQPFIVSESAGTQTEDAAEMKKIYGLL